jgi:hypothetical protein
MICITGNTSDLKCTLFPPLDLSSSKEWEMGFLDLMTYNSIPNVEENVNNKLYFGNDKSLSLPTGSYEISDINKYICKELKQNHPSVTFELVANNNTLKSEIKCSEKLDFRQPASIGSLLGFTEKALLEENKWHISPSQVSINKVDVIRITCNIIRGSYRDGVEGHVLHEFYPLVGPGFKIVEIPKSMIFLPIFKQNSLSEFTVRLEDQEGRLVNFRGENINLRVYIRERRRD